MRHETALMVWWAVGWGGWIDSQMLYTMRRCSPRGARDVLAAAASRGWLRCHYSNARRAVYQVTEVARIAAAAELELPSLAKLEGFRAQTADGQFVLPGGWPHARAAAIGTAELAELYLPHWAIGPDWVFPMCLLPQVPLEKTPDAILEGMDFCMAYEYERSRKPGRDKRRHATWATLERYIGDISAGTAYFRGNQISEIVIEAHERCAAELRRHLDKHCGAMATKRNQVIEWGWYCKGTVERSMALPEEPCD